MTKNNGPNQNSLTLDHDHCKIQGETITPDRPYQLLELDNEHSEKRPRASIHHSSDW